MPSYRLAICNEIYQGWPLAEICRSARSIGYTGLELAPHTLAEDATLLDAGQRTVIRSQLADAGLAFVGLHWLLVSPPGLHITSADRVVRQRSWDYVHRAIDLCADLARGEKSVMVFGSPKQRSTRDGMSAADGVDIWREELRHAGVQADARNVTLLVEAIPASETNVVTTIAEAVRLVEAVGSAAVETMFDVHNTADETEPHEQLVERYFAHIRHVHVNEPDGKEPGMGKYDFDRLLQTLEELQYSGWVSAEAQTYNE